MPESTLWISESEVVTSIDLIDALDVMARAFAAEGAGDVSPMEKTMASFAGGGTLHSLGASFPDLVGVKSWAHTPGGADPALLLIDARNGAIVAVIEAFALGQLRTSATAGLATDRLAASDASVLGVVGTGKQALAQVAAVAAVRQLDAVRVFSPTAEHRAAFAQRVGDELQLESESVGSVAEAVAGADIVTLVTRAKSPVLTEALIRPGVHINAVGAIDLARQEFEPGIISGAEMVVTDSRDQAMKLSSELRQWYGEENAGWSGLRTLGEIVHGGIGRSRPESVTLFKGMGSGVEDVALGVEVLERVLKEGGGRRIDRNGRSRPVLRRPADMKGVRD